MKNVTAMLLMFSFVAGFDLAAQTTTFSYQGRLTDGVVSAGGSYDLRSALFPTSSGGAQIGVTLTNLAVSVSNGFFSMYMDFGASAFSGADRWLELAVRTNGAGPFITLSPRQRITPTPYALMALNSPGLQTNISASSVTNAGTMIYSNGAAYNAMVATIAQSISSTNIAVLGTNNFASTTFVDTNDYLIINRWNGSSFVAQKVYAKDFLSGSNKVFEVGNGTSFRTRPGNPAAIYFADDHGTGHGYVALGALTGDVVITPTWNDGIVQFGATGHAGSYHYLQYAQVPDATYTTGFSHPLEFRALAYNGGVTAYKFPGIVGFPSANDASNLGELRFYARTPHWAHGNANPNSPTISGNEVLRVGTNGIVAAPGIQFKGNGGGLTNLTISGLSGLTTAITVADANGTLVTLNFLNGLLVTTNVASPYDADAQAYFSRAVITNTTEKSAYNTFFLALKSANIFTNWDAIYFLPMEANYGFNAVSASFNITWNGGPVHNAGGGVVFDGVNDYGNTGYNPSSGQKKFSLNSGSLVAYNVTTTIADGSYLIGASPDTTAVVRAGLVRNGTTAAAFGFNNNAQPGAAFNAFADWSGLWIGSRTGSTSMLLDLRGTQTTGSQTTTTLINGSFFIGARSDQGVPGNFFNGELKLVMIGSGLDAGGITALKAAVADLKTTLGW